MKAAVYNSTAAVPVTVSFEGVQKGSSASLTVLTQKPEVDIANGLAKNVLGGIDVVQTTVEEVKANEEGSFEFELPNLSVAVLATQ